MLDETTLPSYRFAWINTLTAALFFFYGFIQLNLFNSIDIDLMQTFHLTAPELGQLASMYFYANTLFLFPAGSLLDRYSTKIILLAAIALCVLGTFIFAIAPSFLIAAMGRFLVGTSASFCFLSAIRIATRWFPPAKMATVTGAVVTMAMLGGLMAQTPMALLVEQLHNWRHAVMVNAVLGIVIFVAVWLIVQDQPANQIKKIQAEQAQLKGLGLWQSLKLAALNPQNWFGGIYTSLLNLPIFLLGALWGIHYLQQVRHLSLVDASYATTMLFIGVIVGSPLFGYISDSIRRRVLPMFAGAALSLVIILILMYAPNLSLAMIMFLFFLIGLVTSSQVLSYPTIAELNPSYLTSTALSIDSMCIMISGFLFQPLFGWMLENVGPHHILGGQMVYSDTNFFYAMWIMPIAFVLGFFLCFWIRETYCKAQA